MNKTNPSDLNRRLKEERKRQKNSIQGSETIPLREQAKEMNRQLSNDNLSQEQRKNVIIQLIINLDNQRQHILRQLSRKSKRLNRPVQKRRLKKVRKRITQLRKTYKNME